MTTDPKAAAKLERAAAHAAKSVDAARRIMEALNAGQPATLEDAKILEAAGCYIRRHAV